MISGVSMNSVQFKSSARDMASQPQRFTNPTTAPAAEPKKKGKAGKIIAGTLIATAAVVTALVLGKNKSWFDKLVTMGEADGAGKIAKGLGKVGEGLNKAGSWLIETGKNAWSKVSGIFGKTEAAVAEAAETVA